MEKINIYSEKAFKNHVLEKTQRKEQKTVIKRMKTERKRKMALLWEQYEKTISELHQVTQIKRDNIFASEYFLSICFFRHISSSNFLIFHQNKILFTSKLKNIVFHK